MFTIKLHYQMLDNLPRYLCYHYPGKIHEQLTLEIYMWSQGWNHLYCSSQYDYFQVCN